MPDYHKTVTGSSREEPEKRKVQQKGVPQFRAIGIQAVAAAANAVKPSKSSKRSDAQKDLPEFLKHSPFAS